MTEARLVALLRGVNVGGKNKVPMRELCAVFAEAGCMQAESYIQSGNVVFRSECAIEELQQKLARRIEERFEFAVPVVVRSAEELRRAMRENPFAREGVPEDRLYVMFLRDWPMSEGLARLEMERFLPDRFAVVRGEIYLDLVTGRRGRS